MKTFFLYPFFGLMLLFMPSAIFAQAPDLGVASSFAVFTGIGAFNNDGTTMVTGDIGTNIGPFAGFPPGTVDGTIHVQDAVSLQASIGVGLAYSYLSAITCDVVLGVGLGNNQVLSPNVYCIGAAATLNGDLILDGQNDPDALFIFQIDGALSTGVNSRVMLINGASLCNVYWQINGAVELGDLSIFLGTFIANGQIEALEGATIFGRALATVGAVSLHNNVIRIGLPPIPADITANGPVTFCEGSSVVLSGNIDGVWNTGETTPTITVTTSGDYFVTNSSVCGSEVSNHIIVTVNPPTPCNINGIPEFCAGQSTELCASPGFAAYLWTNGETSECILVNTAGTYSVTVTDANGCESVCSQTVTENPVPGCNINGIPEFCAGQSTELCASPGFAAYLWSNGETSECILVNTPGTYSVTVTDANGCESVCSQTVTENPVPGCNITGVPTICSGQSTQLCASPGFAAYLWTNGETSECILVNTAGTYSVTVTDANGCESVCSQTVTENPVPGCNINGIPEFCAGQSTELCASPGFAAYLWTNGETSECILVNTAGTYSVTVTDANGCESVCSQIVTENPVPGCNINGIPEFCAGQSTELCASPGFAAYLWSTGETSECILVNTAGTYSVTVTDANGCESVCSQTVTESPLPVCEITGNPIFCAGESTELCTTPGFAAYLWSTGETTNCITVTSAGNYSVTVTDANGCESVCSQTVTESPLPVCEITGNPIFCAGESTELCTTPGFAAYLWSTGETTNCIMVSTPGLFSVTVTDANGCSSTCDYQVILADVTPPVITCPIAVTIECDESTLPANTGTATATDNCIVSPVINFDDVIVAGGLCPQEYSIMRTWTASDGNGNSITCIQTISIEDTTAPVISINNPLLTNGDTIIVSCFGQDPNWNLPNYDEGSVTATDDCGGSVAVAFTHTLENEGTCEEDGYISLFRLTWTATDLCGNSSEVVLSLSLIDNIPPVIFGVPDDITVECEDIPAIPEFVYATDECLCACIVFFEETRPTASCLDGQVLVRTWTATDGCGNTTTETQNITLIDTTGPEWVLDFPEIGSPAPGAIFEYTCEEGGIPAFFSFLNEEAVYDASSCGTVLMVAFDSVTVVSNNCILDGFVAQTTYRWAGYDECGNSSELVLFARLVDHEAPVLIGVPDTSCLGSPILEEITATDDCTQPTIHFWDVNIPNSCGNEMVLRTYEAVDDCGNSSRATTVMITNGGSNPVISFSNLVLAGIATGDTLRLDCAASTGQYTSFGIADVTVENACAENVTLSFSETLVATGDCSINGVIALVELKWTATDICGNASELSIMAKMVDESSPVFPDFEAEITIGCNDTLPVAFVTDNCGEVTITTVDTIVPGVCVFEYSIERIITATDACGNATTRQQIIHVGNGEGPTIEGVDTLICKDLTLPDVTAYDACVGEFVPVTMVQDTLESICEGLVIRRTWTAVNSCGYVSEISQIIIRYDETPPVINIPNNSVIHDYLYYQPQVVYLGQLFELEGLEALDAYSVIVSDDCGETIIPVFTLVVTLPEDCEEAGYFEERVYTWIATDICGNSTTLTFTVNIIDDVPPVLHGVPDNLTIECAPLPAVPEVFTDDTNDSVTIVYTQTIEDGDEPGVFIVTRTWVATDACGNTTVEVQTITWIPDTILECTIILPENVECNTHGVVISSTFTGGVNYDWEIVGEECFIQGGQNTPEITIYIGWSTVKVILTVTDSFGCSSMCMAFLDCSSIYSLTTPETTVERVISDGSTISEDNTIDHSIGSLQNFSLRPNPVSERVFLSFDATVEEVVEIRLISSFGQVILGSNVTAQTGANSYAIDVAELPKGSYLVQVRTRKGLLTKVIIVL